MKKKGLWIKDITKEAIITEGDVIEGILITREVLDNIYKDLLEAYEKEISSELEGTL